MANIKSSKKAIKVIAKKTKNNHETKMRVTNLIKNMEKSITEGNKELVMTQYKNFQKYIDTAVSKGFIKKNTADRQKSRLNTKIKNMK